MNKLTEILIIGLMSCALCGCMSEQEREVWKQIQERKYVERRFSIQGAEYPGTREEYVRAHPLFSKEDIKALLEANSERVVIGSLDMDNYVEKIDFGIPSYLLGEKVDVEWSRGASEEREECRRVCGEFMNMVISHETFVGGMTLEQLRVSLQDPLEVEYVSTGSAMYSTNCKSPNYSTDCTINFTFIDGRLSDWTKIYLPHISEPYVPPMYYYDADGELHIF